MSGIVGVVGNVFRSTIVFAPLGGASTTPGNISARAVDPAGTVDTLTVVHGTGDTYYADVTVADSDPAGRWYVRWESSDPKISAEDSFVVVASGFASP